MKNRPLRIALVVLALLIAAWLAFRGGDEPDSDSTPEPGPRPEAVEGFDPLAGAGEVVQPESAGPIEPIDLEELVERRDVGPPLESGTEVDLGLVYRPGTKSEYEIMTATAVTNRETKASVATRTYLGAETLVVAGSESEDVRVRFHLTWVRMQAIYPNGFQFDFDSRAPDERMLEHPGSALALKPFLAILELPLEFQLGANGAPVAVEGARAWDEAWEVAVNSIDPSLTRDGAPYYDERLLTEWSELLFPPIGSGALAAGDSRDVEILQDTDSRCYIRNRGPLRATHDDGDVFRVTMQATPDLLMRNRGRTEAERAIEKCHVISDADAYYAAWRFRRDPAQLVDTEMETKYQLWTSFRMGRGAGGAPQYEPVFQTIERVTRVNLVRSE